MSKQYETDMSEYKGNDIFQIWEIKNGERSKFPVISFGKGKAEAILASVEEIKKFVEGERGNS